MHNFVPKCTRMCRAETLLPPPRPDGPNPQAVTPVTVPDVVFVRNGEIRPFLVGEEKIPLRLEKRRPQQRHNLAGEVAALEERLGGLRLRCVRLLAETTHGHLRLDCQCPWRCRHGDEAAVVSHPTAVDQANRPVADLLGRAARHREPVAEAMENSSVLTNGGFNLLHRWAHAHTVEICHFWPPSAFYSGQPRPVSGIIGEAFLRVLSSGCL